MLDMHYTKFGPEVHNFHYKEAEVLHVIRAAKFLFASENKLLQVDAPGIIVADVRRQLDLIQRLDQHFVTLGRPPEKRFVFLGDYVDQGAMSLECVLLFAHKVQYPDHVYLLEITNAIRWGEGVTRKNIQLHVDRGQNFGDLLCARVITLFSASAYTNQFYFKNAGGVLYVNEKLDCQLVVYVPDCGPKGAKNRVERMNRL
ncbi:unnamed protein product, partial [Mesorhabditis belari]|uniref:Serine/threonine specific protein phosphatases domain-containing protein n=1 Tax=Mesorhabditis belari TaxID=2138241 RepID=A0AAF3FA60_9BILA